MDLQQQSRNIVLCFDGTSNEVVSTPTNVLRLTRCLVKDDQQVVYYQPGVGTLLDPYALTDTKKWLRKALDLATGFTLRDNVMAGYQFVSRTYRPGDKIYVFGFSRGAYTARAVVGMLNMFGQIRQENENMIPYLWQSYRINIKARPGLIRSDKKLFNNARLYMRLFSLPRSGTGAGIPKSNPVPVEFVGVFDTVSSYLTLALNPLGVLFLLLYWMLLHKDYISFVIPWPLIVLYCLVLLLFVLFRWLPYTDRMPNAKHVRHAVAYDEYRAFFPSDHIAGMHPEHKEVWFAGVHTDVGGGRPAAKSHLAKVALRWMVGEAAACGVRFKLKVLATQLKTKPAVVPDAQLTARLEELKVADPQQYVLAQQNGGAALAPRGKSGNTIWLPAGLVPQLRFRRKDTGGRRSGEAIDPLAAHTAASQGAQQAEQAGMIRVCWPNFARFRFIRKGDRIHWSVALRRELGMLSHPRVAGVEWSDLEVVGDLPIAGVGDS